MARYQTSVTVTFNQDTDREAKDRHERIYRLLKGMFPDARVRATTFEEKPLRMRGSSS